MATARWVVWVRNTALIGIIAAFVLFFGMPMGSAPVDVVAEVDGESIGRDIFEFFREQNSRILADNQVDGSDTDGLQSLIDRQTVDGLLRRYILAQEAHALGMRVSDAEVRDEILADPRFRDQTGRFDRNRFEVFVARNDLGSERVYTEELRRDLLLRKFRLAVTSPVRISERQVREGVEKVLAGLRLRVAAARTSDFREQAAPGADEIAQFIGGERPRLEALFQSRSAEFQQPESIRARHILFRGEKARERSEQALARIRGGESFQAVARELSEDEATRDEGGALGQFPRGRMLPEFEQSAFALATGQVSEPVETTFGYHLILVEEHQQAVERNFEQVAPTLARQVLIEQQARERAQKAVDLAASRIQGGSGLRAAAGEAGLELSETPLFKLGDPEVAGLPAIPALREAAAALTREQPASSNVFEAPDGFYLIELIERQEADTAQVDLEVSRIREQIEQGARAELSDRWYRARRAELERAGRLVVYPLNRGS